MYRHDFHDFGKWRVVRLKGAPLKGAPGLVLRAGTLLALLFCASGAALAQWSQVTPGIDYREFTVSGPNRVFVARMDRTEPSVTIDSLIAQGRLSGGRETVSQMVSRYDQSIGYWGEQWGGRYEIKVAINGHFFDLNTGVPEPGQILSGWYAWRLGNFGGRSGFAWKLDRQAFIGACINHRPGTNFILFEDQSTQPFDDVNRARGQNELILFTTHYDAATPSQTSGVEVVVRMDQPALILPSPAKAEGTVVDIRENQGSTPLWFDHLVLSAAGSAASALLAKVSVGDRIGVTQEIATYQLDCNTPDPVDWTKTYAHVGGNFQFLRQGAVQPTSDPGLTARHPRTAIAINASYVFFLVVDGRTAQSVGMTMTELANFCLSELSATDGVNHDGGGSSAIWVDGQIRNNPSDGVERTVANGIMMARLHERSFSSAHWHHDTVAATGSATVRLGPGTHFASHFSASAGQQGAITAHSAGGVLAKGAHWWEVEFAGGKGWVSEASLELIARGPDAGTEPPPDGGTEPLDSGALTDGWVFSDAGQERDSGPDAGRPLQGAASGCQCGQEGPRGSGPLELWLPLLLLGLLVRLKVSLRDIREDAS